MTADRRVLITGSAGLLGSALVTLAPPGVQVHGTIRSRPAPGGAQHRVDLSDGEAVRTLWEEIRPQLVVHTAYDPQDLLGGIVLATDHVARACAAVGADVIHVSSDRVLDGDNAPYDELAAPAPIEAYGEAKAEAERRVQAALPHAAIVRTSLIVGTEPPDRISAGLLEALREGREAKLFVDELRCPIHVDDLARQIWEIAAIESPQRAGVWNLVGPEATSRFGLGLLVARRAGQDAAAIVPALNRDLPTRRPRDLRLGTARAAAHLATRARPISEALFPI